MTLTRRELVYTALALSLPTSISAQERDTCAPASKRSAPEADSLAAGDFLWPKRPDAIVPFSSQPGVAGTKDRQVWEATKKTYLLTLEAKPTLTAEEKSRFEALQRLTYEQFVILYLDDHPPGEISPFGTMTRFYVGHVAIVVATPAGPEVVEAVMGKGVQRISYPAWRKERPGELVWQARLQGVSADTGMRIAQTAEAQIGKAYDFWNFDLSDQTGFYCSKLSWYAVWKATGDALDGDVNPRRRLWYSPKQMLKSSRLCLINSPGNYAFK